MIEHGNLRVGFRVEFSVNKNLRFLDTGCPTRSTFDCRFDYSLGPGVVNFRLVQQRRISGFHNCSKISNA